MNYWRLQKTALHPCPVCLKNISKRMSAIWRPSSELSGCVRPRNHRWQLKWSARFVLHVCNCCWQCGAHLEPMENKRRGVIWSRPVSRPAPTVSPRGLRRSRPGVCPMARRGTAGSDCARKRLTGDTGPLCGCLEFVLPHLCLTTPKPQAKPAWHRRTYPSPNPLCFLRPESYY